MCTVSELIWWYKWPCLQQIFTQQDYYNWTALNILRVLTCMEQLCFTKPMKIIILQYLWEGKELDRTSYWMSVSENWIL